MQAMKPAAQELPDMQANNSIAFDDKDMNVRLISKRDGSKMPFDEQILRDYLMNHTEGLNQDFIDIDVIIKKVSSGLYNGKFIHPMEESGWAHT